MHGCKRGHADGQGTGLVEDDCIHVADAFHRAAVAEEDSVARGPVEATDDGDRRRQDQGTGCCDDQNTQHPQRVTRQEPCCSGHEQGEWGEPDRGTIGQALDRGLARFGRPDQRNYARVLAFRRQRGDANGERRFLVDAAAGDMIAGYDPCRHRLASEAGGIEVRAAGRHLAVGGHQLAGAHHHPVAQQQVIHIHVCAAIGAEPMGSARC